MSPHLLLFVVLLAAAAAVPVEPVPPAIPAVTPHAGVGPTPPPSLKPAASDGKSLDQLEAVRARKAQLEMEEQRLADEVRRKLETQNHRLQRLGVRPDSTATQPITPVRSATSAGFWASSEPFDMTMPPHPSGPPSGAEAMRRVLDLGRFGDRHPLGYLNKDLVLTRNGAELRVEEFYDRYDR